MPFGRSIGHADRSIVSSLFAWEHGTSAAVSTATPALGGTKCTFTGKLKRKNKRKLGGAYCYTSNGSRWSHLGRKARPTCRNVCPSGVWLIVRNMTLVHGTAGTTFSSVWHMNCVMTSQVGAPFRLCWQLQTSRCSSDCPSSGVPPTKPCTRLGSSCNRVQFMTIKAGNVVDKVRRSLRNVCASSSAAIFHPVSIIYWNISVISSAKNK